MKELYFVRRILIAGGLLLQLNWLCFHSRGAAGDVDLSFDPGSGVNGAVWAAVLQPYGKVIIGGAFTTVKGLLRTNLARLNADGSGDSSFNPGTGGTGILVRSRCSRMARYSSAATSSRSMAWCVRMLRAFMAILRLSHH